MVSVGNLSASWWRVDFHVHSPASFDFGAEEGERSTVTVSYEDWILAYMRAEIDAIVVTDHNGYAGIDQARIAVDRLRDEHPEYRKINVIAGVEITVEGGYHLLAVFDVNTPGSTIHELLSKVYYNGEYGESNSTSKYGFEQAIDTIVEMGGLAIPAHVDGPKGLYLHDQRNIDSIVNAGKVLAVETISDEGIAKAWKSGWLPVLGSDAHHLDGLSCPEGVEAKYPGSHFTWMKMGSPNLSGIRLAITDGESSVKLSSKYDGNPNDYDHSVIEKVVVRHAGEEQQHIFSPWMNAIIGGRGVGKSTIVEIIRLCMGRFSDLPLRLQNDLEWFSPNSSRGSSERFWDKNTEIDLYYRKLDKNYRVKWVGSDPNGRSSEVLDGDVWQSSIGVASSRFPVILNSQKQIYETALDPQSFLKMIDAQGAVDRSGWDAEFNDLSQKYRTQRSEISEISARMGTKDQVQGDLQDALDELAQISKLRDSAEVRELDTLRVIDQNSMQREAASELLEGSLQEAVDSFDNTRINLTTDGLDSVEIKRVEELNSTLLSIRLVIDRLRQARESWESIRDTVPRVERISELQILLTPVGVVVGTSDSVIGNSGVGQTDRYSELILKRAQLQSSVREIEAAEARFDGLVAAADKLLVQIHKHRSELTEKRQKYLNTLAGPAFKLNVSEQADGSEVEASLRRVMHKDTSFDFAFSTEGLRSILEFHPQDPRYLGSIAALKLALKDIHSNGTEAASRKLNYGTLDARFCNHVSSLKTSEFFTEVDLWFPEDRMTVKYRPDGNTKMKNLDQGSPGQKTAALLTIILQMGDEPLVLDQPEDDLDNKLIFDLVVRTLKQVKTRRQVIVVTHNANVVVNADAESVSIVNHGVIPSVEMSGSIQDSDVRDSICLIMEGGETAFQARYSKLIL